MSTEILKSEIQERKRNYWWFFDDLIADIIIVIRNVLHHALTYLLRVANKISFIFITKSYFPVIKDVKLNTTYFSIMKIPNNRELQQIATNYSCDIDFKNFMRHYESYLWSYHHFWFLILFVHQITLKAFTKTLRIIIESNHDYWG